MVDASIFEYSLRSPIGDDGSRIWVRVPVVFFGDAVCPVFGSVYGVGYDGAVFHGVVCVGVGLVLVVILALD